MNRFFLFLSFASLLFTACHHPEPVKEDLVSKPEEVDPHLTKDLEKQLSKIDTAKPFVIANDTLLTAKTISDLFKQRQYEPLWSREGNFDYRFFTMLRLIRNARYYFGLVPDAYHYKKIDSLSKHLTDYESGKTDVAKLAQIEMLTTDAFFTMAHHLHHGRVKIEDSLIVRSWQPGLIGLSLDSVLLFAFEKNNLRQSLESFEPKFEQYFLLKRELRKFIDEHKGVKWCAMPDIKKDSAGYMDSVKLRMVQMNFYDTAAKGNDSLKLAKAMKKFQRYYRLTEDGKVGKEMMVALDYTIEKRTRQIEM